VQEYKQQRFYWESVVMLRKFAVVATTVFLVTSGPLMQLMSALGLIIIATVAQVQ
jgi:hypothetical protein